MCANVSVWLCVCERKRERGEREREIWSKYLRKKKKKSPKPKLRFENRSSNNQLTHDLVFFPYVCICLWVCWGCMNTSMHACVCVRERETETYRDREREIWGRKLAFLFRHAFLLRLQEFKMLCYVGISLYIYTLLMDRACSLRIFPNVVYHVDLMCHFLPSFVYITASTGILDC